VEYIIVAREVMPTWERMWDDFVREEIRLVAEAFGQRQQQSGQGDDDLALWTKGKKKADCGGRQGPKFGAPPQGSGGESNNGQRRDMSKVKCFVCKKFGNYAGQCPNRKKKKGGTAATTEEVDFQTQFQRECAFLICYTSVEMTPSIWYIDSGASSHMTGVREDFIDLRDTEVRIEIALGDDTLVRVAGIGTVTFRRDSMPPISFRDILYVPGLKKNLISVSTL
jgi:hypothetical protein